MGYLWNRYRCQFERHNSGEIVTDKEKCAASYSAYFYIRLMKMFSYKGLPKTIPQDVLEYYLLRNGSCFITEAAPPRTDGTEVGVDGSQLQLFAFIGNPGGEHDAYYRPTLYVCSNPYLNLTFEKPMWGDEGVFCVNDSMWLGLEPIIQRYAYLMAENVLTMRTADIMLRIIALITAPDDKTKDAADVYLQNIVDGKLGSIGDNPFFEGIKMQSPPSNNGSYLTQFIELHQYYKGSFYNEIGLQANFNMKREAIGVGEAAMSQDSLLPLCDDMLEKRKEFCERLNELYGLNIEVDFSSAWKNTREEIEKELNDGSQLQEGGDNVGESKRDAEIEGDPAGEVESIEKSGGEAGDDGLSELSGGEAKEENNENENSEEENSGDESGHDSGDDSGNEADSEDDSEAAVEVKVEVKVGEQDEENVEDSGSDVSGEGSVSEDEL